MSFKFGLFLCLICCSLSLASNLSYRAGYIDSSKAFRNFESYVPLIQEAGRSNVDIMVLPSPQISSSVSSLESSCGLDNYDEIIQTLSEASKQAGLYVVAHLLEKTRCHNKYELLRSNLVFDREGNVVSVYRKPVNNVANCTTAASEIATFTTDFGVQFGLLMEEDLVLQKLEDLKGLKNYVVTGAWSSEIPFLSAPQFASTWAFTNNVNLLSSSGMFAGRNGEVAETEDQITIGDLKKSGGESHPIVPPVVSSSKLAAFLGEDLSQYIIRPLDLTASARGYKETVCHGQFCCEFFVKTSFGGAEDEVVNYGLAASHGIRHFDSHNIGFQSCSIFACAGLYKRTCTIGSNKNTTNVLFEKISISSNFLKDSPQYPVILTTGTQSQANEFIFETKVNPNNQNQVTLEICNVDNLLSFGIFGRDYAKDSERLVFVEGETISFTDEMQDLFDYLWIRIRVLMVVASIYFLEMM